MTTFTPREIKNRKFKQSLMGVDADEVKGFLKIVAAEFDRILTQNAQLEKRLTEQTVRSTLGTKKEAEKHRQTLEEADKAAGEIIARAKEEADEIRRDAEREVAELRRRAEREAHEKARRETALMLQQAKVMADEVLLNAKQKAEKIEAEAREALASAEAAASDFERPLSVAGPGDPDDGEEMGSEEALQNFDTLIAEARVKAEAIIQSTRAEAEMVTSSLIGRTLGELNKEHERLLAAVQNAVHKSEEIVKAAREEAEQFAVRRKSDAVEQCNAVLLEAERKAGAIFNSLRSQAASRRVKPAGEAKPADGGRKASPKFQ
ncbi:MAG: V-type ATP synthase subunit E [Syntrophaceae bacterium PtaB.Bin038]|nr:MAG: V-type ATP synthase subunit E [Syntrophaceae bacterium PtaB.Bin038]